MEEDAIAPLPPPPDPLEASRARVYAARAASTTEPAHSDSDSDRDGSFDVISPVTSPSAATSAASPGSSAWRARRQDIPAPHGLLVGLDHAAALAEMDTPPEEAAGFTSVEQGAGGEGRGATAYAFGGVFACGMYGAVESRDPSTGYEYTEYVLRCQWGRTFETMQPWLVGRRFREFAALDEAVRMAFPDAATALHPLPQKLVFISMSPDVVEHRRGELEIYIGRIVTSLPDVLQSAAFDAFLGVTERVRSLAGAAARSAGAAASAELMPRASPAGGGGGGGGSTGWGGSVVAAADADAAARLEAAVAASAAATNEFGADFDDLGDDADTTATMLNPEIATAIFEAEQPPPLDSDGLGEMETNVHHLTEALRAVDHSEPLSASLRAQLRRAQAAWPRLKATAMFDRYQDVSLVPRAMQCDEDLAAAAGLFRSVVMVREIG